MRSAAQHGTAFERWKAMGSPQAPTPEQQAELVKAAQLAELPEQELDVRGGEARLRVALPRQAVSLLLIEPAR